MQTPHHSSPPYASASLSLLALALLAAPPALAQDKEADKKDAPGFGIQTRSKVSDADQTEESILASVENQKMVLELEDDSSSDYPDMLVALADFYWDLSEVYFRKAHSDAIEQAIFDAEERKDLNTLTRLRGQQKSLEDKQRRYQKKTIETYRLALRDFPNARKVDEIRYYLGYNLSSMGKAEEAVAAYTDLILKHPRSSYVPDALVNIGEYYFEVSDFASALKLYEQVQQYPQAPVLAYAIYKQGWCHYNLGAYDVSMSRFLAVIKMARQQHELGMQGAFDLMTEVQSELVYPYSKIGKPGASITFFKRYAPERYLQITSRLAQLYTEQAEYAKSTKLLRSLIKEARKEARRGGDDRRYMILQFQRQIVDNAHREADKPKTVAEVQELIKYFEELAASAPPKFRDTEEREIDRKVLDIATGYHEEYRSTKAERTLEYTQVLYDEYLRIFRDKPNAYAISYNNALLMLMTGKYRSAAAEFERVIAMKPDGKHADDAGERAVIAYLKNLQINNKDVKNEAEEDLTRRDLTADEQRFVDAVDRWMGIIGRRGVDPTTADNIPPAKFAAAKILYNANHFQDAAQRFASFYDKHKGHEWWEESARHILSAYNLAHDVDNLRRFANIFDRDPELMATTLKDDVFTIRNEFDFMECFKHEKAKTYLRAAECFIDYTKNFAGAQKVPAAVYNAGLNYFRAKRVSEALNMQKRLFEQYSSHELAPKALYSIGEIFRETTVYEQASDVYEAFVASYGDHPLAEKALRYASIFRKTLGQYPEAIKNLKLYLKKYEKPETGPRVHFDIALIMEKQEKWSKVLKTIKTHEKRYPGEPADLHLRLLNLKARALKSLKAKRKKAPEAFRQVVEYFRTLSDDQVGGLSMAAVSAVAEAHFEMGEAVLDQATSVRLAAGEKKMQEAIKKKLALMGEAKQVYEQVIAYGHPGWTIAAYTQLGLAFRDLAEAVENAPVPKRIKRDELAVDEYRQIMTEKAEPIRGKALKSYRKALEVAREAHWFNEYSERAEQAIAQLDLSDVSIKEARLRPTRTGANAGLPRFAQEVQ